MAVSAELAAAKAKIRRELQVHGTDVDLNDRTPLGDGDQTPIDGPNDNNRRQFYRNLFSEGGDIFEHLSAQAISKFAFACVMGATELVKAELEKADDGSKKEYPSENLIQLLEFRETSMRLSPLLMMVSITKNIGVKNLDMEREHLEIVKLLLQYGARPQAKDVAGKTVCHYGMGAMASKMTLKAGSMCVDAHKSSHFFGKEVELHGLKAAHMNGKRGVARGYIVASGRRAVHIFGEKEPIGIKPQNIKLAGEVDAPARYRAVLCDRQDRVGSLCLHEVIMKDRVDVAEVLLEEYGARVDIEDYEGVSPQNMAMAGAAGFMSRAATMVQKAAMKKGRKMTKVTNRKCVGCVKLTDGNLACSRCKSTYCSESCQKSHWKEHKKSCKTKATADAPIVIDSATNLNNFAVTINATTGMTSNGDSFQKPAYAEYGQPFYVKVQCGQTPTVPMMIYDQTRECNFAYGQEKAGFHQLFAKTRAQSASDGRKSYYKASFGEDGKMTVFPGTSTLKTDW